MAAKFSMAGAGLFDQSAHAEAADRLQGAVDDLRVRSEHSAAADSRAAAQQRAHSDAQAARLLRSHEAAAANAQLRDVAFVRSAAGSGPADAHDDSDSDDDVLLDELEDDPELERLRTLRMSQLKQAYEAKQELLAKGHGEYREISQDEFLAEVTASPRVAVHFYHNDFERCKIVDMHLSRLAKTHIECKFLKLNAEKAPFFVQKLAVRVLPTIVCFRDGVAFPSRVVGFDGLTADDEEEESAAFGSRGHLTASDAFPTIALARKLVQIGAVDEHDADADDE
ncbi:hypothetical protein PybrP1_012842 [[Pythium] brassicae (nom. inval.)]|nr:hypothetical protein PybrP1_012842 [[Pythium] brassicae (nom. inval.)]